MTTILTVGGGKSPEACFYIDKNWLAISRKQNAELEIICKTNTNECQKKRIEYFGQKYNQNGTLKYGGNELGAFNGLPQDLAFQNSKLTLLNHNRKAQHMFSRATAQNGSGWDKMISESVNAY